MIWLLIYKKNVYLQTLNEESFSGCSVARSSRLVWDEEVAGSNPATPTKIKKRGAKRYLNDIASR